MRRKKMRAKKMNSKTLLAAAGIAAFAFSPAHANEGFGAQTKPGALIGASAGVPPPGIYMFNQVFTYQANVAGPGNGGNTRIGLHANVDVQGFVFVPGWTFLGAKYDAVLVQPWEDVSVGSPINAQFSGLFNTYIAPVELSWKLGDSGLVFKTGLGIYVPDGTETGALKNGNVGAPGALKNGNVGAPYWTFQPEAILSYLKDGWNITAAVYDEINTQNTVTHYTSGDILHADFTVTKTIGKWTIGPVAYYTGQVTHDTCPASCVAVYGANQTLANSASYNVWAVGGLVGYNFGPASLSVWATQEVSAKASNAAAAAATGADPSTVNQGTTVFATLSYRLWAPDAPAEPAMYRK
jgi:hypothetical protein